METTPAGCSRFPGQEPGLRQPCAAVAPCAVRRGSRYADMCMFLQKRERVLRARKGLFIDFIGVIGAVLWIFHTFA